MSISSGARAIAIGAGLAALLSAAAATGATGSTKGSAILEVIPASPVANEPIDVQFIRTSCDNVLRIEPTVGGFRMVFPNPPNPFICDDAYDDRVALGSLPPGTYALERGTYAPDAPTQWRPDHRIEFVVSAGPAATALGAELQGPDWSGVWTSPEEPATSFQIVHSRQPDTTGAQGRAREQVDAAWYTYGPDGSPTWFYVIAAANRGSQNFVGRVYRINAQNPAQPADQRQVALTDLGPARFEFARYFGTDRFIATIGSTEVDLDLERFRWTHGAWAPIVP